MTIREVFVFQKLEYLFRGSWKFLGPPGSSLDSPGPSWMDPRTSKQNSTNCQILASTSVSLTTRQHGSLFVDPSSIFGQSVLFSTANRCQSSIFTRTNTRVQYFPNRFFTQQRIGSRVQDLPEMSAGVQYLPTLNAGFITQWASNALKDPASNRAYWIHKGKTGSNPIATQ